MNYEELAYIILMLLCSFWCFTAKRGFTVGVGLGLAVVTGFWLFFRAYHIYTTIP